MFRILALLILLIAYVPVFAKEKDKKEKEIPEPDTKLPSRITYNFGGVNGFGKNLLAYMRAKWLSHNQKIPLLYKPFTFSNQLTLHTTEKRFNEYDKKMDATKFIKHDQDIEYMDPNATLYVVPYFAESSKERELRNDPVAFEVNWEDKEFKKILKKYVSPLKQLEEIKLVKDRINIAVHVRYGHGEENDELKKQLPLKFPHENYYVKQIKRLSKSFQGRPLYVYIFTDHKNPGELVRKFQKALKMDNIKIESNKAGNLAKTHVLDDFFNMLKFDCLIRPESHFSIAAEAVGEFLVTITPVSYNWDPKKQRFSIDAVNVKVR